MSDTELSLKLSQGDIEKIIHTAIQAQVTAAMTANSDALIGTFVDRILNEKVDSEGKPSTYRSDTPFIEWLSRRTIQQACRQAIEEWLAENKPMVVAEVKRALTKNKAKLATEAADTLIHSGKYGLNVSIAVAKREKDY